MKTILRLTLCALFALCSLYASAYDFEVDGIYYNVSNTDATVTYKNDSLKSYSGEIVIPESVVFSGNTYKVSAIGEKAFGDCSKLLEVTIPNSIITIESYAFEFCDRLLEISIPNSVTTIGDNAFVGSGLRKLTFGDNVKSIGNSAFAMCESLITLNLGGNISTIGEFAFYSCSGLEEVTIGSNVSHVENMSFSGCTGLRRLTLEDGKEVITIESSAFYDCPIQTLYVGRDVRQSKNPPFRDLSTLSLLTIGDKVTSIDSSAFSFCKNMQSLTLGSNIEIISDYAFYNCNLIDIISNAETPPSLNQYTFNDETKMRCSLSVPSQSVSKYIEDYYWGAFQDIEEMK